MVSRGLTLGVFVAIAVLAGLDQGAALQCRVCDSLTNKDCSEDPSKVIPTTCGAVNPTEKPTEKPTESPTEKPTESPTEKPTESPTEKPTESPTEKPTEQPTEKTTVQPTEKPTDKPTDKPTEKTTVQPTEKPTDKPTEKTTVQPTEKPTEKTSVQPEPSSTPKSKETDSRDQSANAVHEVNRRRRNIMSLREADSDYTCYKLVYKSNQDEVIERGCHTKENACDRLKEVDGKKDADCYTCEKDGCNASSTISLGILSIIAPSVLLAVFRW